MNANQENRFKTQAINHLEKLNSGLARLYQRIKRNENQAALDFMENDLKDLYERLEDTIKSNQDTLNNNIGTL
jgi:uncharacterized coiled-coil protein SlyX